MKRVNIIYLAVFPIVFLLFQLSKKHQQSGAFFYGFAENKETNLSHDLPIKVVKIHVTPGQAVNKGDILMEVEQTSLGFQIEDIKHDVKRIDAVMSKDRQELQTRMTELQTSKLAKQTKIQAEIQQVEAKIAQAQSLVEGLQTIRKDDIDFSKSEDAIHLANLKKELELVGQQSDIAIEQIQKELRILNSADLVEQQQLEHQISYYTNEQKQLVITAPDDGIIGNLLCKEGENVDKFIDLLTFYERNPTLVKGYIHESMILQVEMGDSLFVSSSLQPSERINGRVVGLGSRIVEIPERLRKVPDIKTYGREILIRIPRNNSFLQKEKVMLNAIVELEELSMSRMFSFLS